MVYRVGRSLFADQADAEFFVKTCCYCRDLPTEQVSLDCHCENVACYSCYMANAYNAMHDRLNYRCPDCGDVSVGYVDPPWELAFRWDMMFITPSDFEELVAQGMVAENSSLRSNVRVEGPRRFIIPYSEPEVEDEEIRADMENREQQFWYMSYDDYRRLELQLAQESGSNIEDLWIDL